MRIQRNSRVATLLFVACAAGAGALSCARTHDRRGTPEEAGDEGDSAEAFAEISVRVETYDGFNDPIRTDARTPSTQSAYVFINGAGSEGRVPELRVFHGDQELHEVGNAGAPQQFSYQGRDQPIEESTSELRLQLGEARFSYPLEISDVDLVEPEKGAELHTSGEFRVRWSGAAPPESLLITPIAGSTCDLTFSLQSRDETEAIYAVTANPGFNTRACRAELTAQWKVAGEPTTDTPFAAFAITRHAKRTRRFLLSQLSGSGTGGSALGKKKPERGATRSGNAPGKSGRKTWVRDRG